MTTLLSRSLLPEPSPSKFNPFARPKFNHEPSSFTRSTLLPTLPSPHKTPANKLINGTALGTSSAGKNRQGWRLLWRGGLEIGKDGWRLDGITFFALLDFPVTTPSIDTTPNPFDAPQTQSPFPSLPATDTDLCLSLESMRGRKYLQIRGVVELPEDEVLDGAEDAGGVQMSISPQAPLLAAYFTSLLCRNETLSAQGRTLFAILIGLGDEGIDSGHASTILVYGQRSLTSITSSASPPALRLCVARRKAPLLPPSERKVQPGEPLPRAPLFFPAKAPKRPPPPFPRRNGSGSRTLSRNPSVSSIYQPPQPVPAPVAPAPIPGRTPGRRGEKRSRLEGDRKDDDRKRKSGKIVPSRVDEDMETIEGNRVPASPGATQMQAKEVPPLAPEEDIFGLRPTKVTINGDINDRASSFKGEDEPQSTGRAKRTRVPQRVSDNKAAIRKQTLLLMAERGVNREDEQFKEVFGMTTKGAYFAFRARLESGPLEKIEVQAIVNGHLGMYLPSQQTVGLEHMEDIAEEDKQDMKEDLTGDLSEDANIEYEPG